MRQLLLTVCLLATALSLFAAVDSAAAGEAHFTLFKNEPACREILFDDIDFSLDTVTIEGQTFASIDAPGGARISEPGMPDLPSYTRLVAVPATGRVRLEVLGWDETRQPCGRIAPAQAIKLDGSQPEFAMNREVYEQRREGVFPAAPASIGSPAVMRDLRLVPLTVQPLAWDAASSELVVRSNIRVRVVTDENERGENEVATHRAPSRSFQNLYSYVLGYERDEEEEYQQRSILIIYANNTTARDVASDIADWKRSKGFYVEMASISVAGSTSSQIKSYIVNCYNNWENPVEYVILIGDATGSISVPTHFENVTTYSGETDHPYTMLVGNDVLPEVFIGRISANTTNDLLTYWTKIVNYEIYPYTDNLNWYHKTVLISDTGTSGISTYITNQHARDLIQSYDPQHTFTELTSVGPHPTSINNAINQGKLITSYRGIGGLGGWSTYDIDDLDNDFMLSNGVIMTCDTGSFASGTARSEAWIRAGTPSAPTGGATCISMATNGTHTAFNNALHGGIFYGLYVLGMPNMGEALMCGKLNLYNTYCDFSTYFTDCFTYWCNLMGDPTLDVWKTQPRELDIACVNSIAEGVNWVDVTITTSGLAVDEAWVTARQKDDDGVETTFGTGYTDINGHVRLIFDTPQIGELQIVATKPQFKPEFHEIDVAASGVGYQSLAIADNGDNDGCADAGETLTLTTTLHNFADNAMSNVQAQLSTEDEYLTITQASDTFGSISAGGAATGSGFTATLATDCPENHRVQCKMLVTSGADSWECMFTFVAQGGDLDVIDWSFDDGGNGALDPGETGVLTVKLRNNGQVDISSVAATLKPVGSLTLVADSLGAWGYFHASEELWNSNDSFTITGMPLLVPGMTAEFQLAITGDSGYTETETFSIPIGAPAITDPLGPDAGGYFCYDDHDTGYEDCPTYDWIEINPSSGGSGTNTNIVDGGEDDDDVCHVDLPFDFTFYGRTYDEITICSNGWISFLDTNQMSFRNHPIPGPMGPRAMIAAFWDDLSTSYGGGVYTWYDQTHNLFVIEWSEVRNRYNNNVETFEIILYDPAYYPTLNDNGMIKIQYEEFNNVNQGYTSQFYPEHGLYCTVGIEDHTGTVGLEYTFNNQYPATARTLGDNTAILFTGAPQSTPGSDLLVVDYSVNGASQLFVPYNSNVTLNVKLQNIGGGTATNITATLETESPYVNITQASGAWPDLPLMQQSWAQSDMAFGVSNACPDNQQIELELHVCCDQGDWTFPVMLTCWAPRVEMLQYELTDDDGNGWLSAGESVSLDVWLCNKGHYSANQVEAFISSSQDWVTITQGAASVSSLGVGDTGPLDTTYSFTIDSDAPSTATLWIDLAIIENSGMSLLQQIELNVGFHDDVEHGVNNWEHEILSGYYDDWRQATERYSSSSHSWCVGRSNSSYNGNQFSALVSPVIELAPNSWLTFSHWLEAEESGNYPGQAYDGAQVQLLYNDVWNVITPQGGYSHVARGGTCPFTLGSEIWSGEFDWTRAWFDLSAYTGEVQIRFVFGADDGTQYEGWYIDDIAITGAGGGLTPPSDLFAQNIGNDVVRLDWTAPTTPCTGYNIYRRWSLERPFVLAATTTSTTYTDNDPFAPLQYYVVTAAYESGESRYSNCASATTSHQAVGDEDIPAVTTLGANYPNPFNPETTIHFSLASPGRVKLAVYNVRGQRVATLVDAGLDAGGHEIVWHGEDSNGAACASGVYLYRLEAGGEVQTRKMLLLK